MLSKLSLEGLRGVGKVELELDSTRQLFAFFGQNGVGKTKCLEAIFQFLLFGNRLFLSELSRHGIESSFAVMSRATDQAGHVFSVQPNTPMHLGAVWGTGERGFHDLPVVFLGALNRSSLTDASTSAPFLGSFSSRRQKYLEEVFNALRQRDLRRLGMSGDVQSWFVARAHSVNPYQRETDNREVEISSVLRILNAMDERIDGKFLQVDGAGRVAIKIDEQVRMLSELSSGFTSLVNVVQAIVAGYGSFTNESNLADVRGIVLIDEVESHLHVRWQSQILPKLKLLLPNTTFYVATHSPLALTQLDQGEAYLLERDGDGTVRSKLIDAPSRQAFVDVLEDAFALDLNALKRSALERSDQTAAKNKLLQFLEGKAAE